jgi:hypothetical protein
VQDGEEDGALDGELEAAVSQEFTEDVAAAGLVPEAFKDQGRAEAARGDDRDLAIVVSGEQEELLAKASAGGEEGVELTGVLEVIEATQGAKDALLGPAAIPEVFDELEVAAGSGGFDAKEHGGLAKKETP